MFPGQDQDPSNETIVGASRMSLCLNNAQVGPSSLITHQVVSSYKIRSLFALETFFRANIISSILLVNMPQSFRAGKNGHKLQAASGHAYRNTCRASALRVTARRALESCRLLVTVKNRFTQNGVKSRANPSNGLLLRGADGFGTHLQTIQNRHQCK